MVVIEMQWVNAYLSGMGLKDSRLGDRETFITGQNSAHAVEFRGLFEEASEYREVARFDEGYFMPQHTLTDRLLGNRMRNYVNEVVIFVKDGPVEESVSTGGGGQDG